MQHEAKGVVGQCKDHQDSLDRRGPDMPCSLAPTSPPESSALCSRAGLLWDNGGDRRSCSPAKCSHARGYASRAVAQM